MINESDLENEHGMLNSHFSHVSTQLTLTQVRYAALTGNGMESTHSIRIFIIMTLAFISNNIENTCLTNILNSFYIVYCIKIARVIGMVPNAPAIGIANYFTLKTR